MHSNLQLTEIATELRRLQERSPLDKGGLDAWYSDSRQFAQRLSSQFADVDLPEEVWHYLHDADLRLNDPDHRRLQDEMLAGVIADLERGVIPEPRGPAIALHPRWVGVAGLVVVVLILYWVAK